MKIVIKTQEELAEFFEITHAAISKCLKAAYIQIILCQKCCLYATKRNWTVTGDEKSIHYDDYKSKRLCETWPPS